MREKLGPAATAALQAMVLINDLAQALKNGLQPSVKVLIGTTDGCLVLQRRDDKPGIKYPGFLTTIGGDPQRGETVREAARREGEEECGVASEDADLAYVGFVDPDDGQGKRFFYFARLGRVEADSLVSGEGTIVALTREEVLADLAAGKATPILALAYQEFPEIFGAFWE